MISLTLTAKVLTQSADKVDLDAEQRKAKLRSLLVRPPSTSALPQTNAQQITTSLSQDKSSEPSLSNRPQINKNLETKITPLVSNEREEEKLIEFLQSRKVNQTNDEESFDRKPIKLQASLHGCNFEQDSGTLNCKDGLEFFDVNLAYKQTLQSINEKRRLKEDVLELSRIDIFSCNIPIMFSLERNDSSFSRENDPSILIRQSQLENVKTVAIVNSGVESIQDGAFDAFSETLIQLDLSNNKLDRIPSAILKLRQLIDLNLGGNQISQLPALPTNLVQTAGSFRNLVRLSSLNIGNNRSVHVCYNN